MFRKLLPLEIGSIGVGCLGSLFFGLFARLNEWKGCVQSRPNYVTVSVPYIIYMICLYAYLLSHS